MKTLLHLTIAGLLAGGMTLTVPAHAQQEDKSDDLPNFVMQHTVGGNAQPEETLKADAVILFEAFKRGIASQTSSLPAEITTTLTLMLSKDMPEEVIKALSPLTIVTTVAKNGEGSSQYTMPAVELKLPESDGDSAIGIEWSGLNGSFTFDREFKNWVQDGKFGELSASDDAGFSMETAAVTFSGAMDEDMIPTRIKADIPMIKMRDTTEEIAVDLSGLFFDIDSIPGAVDISKGGITLEKMSVDNAGSVTEILGLMLMGDGAVDGDVVNYTLNTKIDKLASPDLMPGQVTELNYRSNLSLHKLDLEFLQQLQSTARDLQHQRRSGTEVSEDMMGIALMGVIMQALPNVWAKSPEIALTDLLLEMAEGELKGSATLSIDGSKPFSMGDPAVIKQAIVMNAGFSVDKNLLSSLLKAQMASEMGENVPDDEEMNAMVSQQIDGMVQGGMLQADGDVLRLEASMKDAQFLLNGQLMPLPF